MSRQRSRMYEAKQRLFASRRIPTVVPGVPNLQNLLTNHRIQSPAIPALPHGYKSPLAPGYVVPYKHDYGIAADATVNLLLAFLSLSTALRRNARLEMMRNPPASITRPVAPTTLFYCDFESGWCPGWNQSRSDELDMIVHKGPTKTKVTGPSVDHTRFNSYGHYAYLEASGSSFGARAWFRTPYVLMNSEPKYCLRFWYHMLGVGVGTLKVYWSPPKKIGNAPATVFLISAAAGSQSRNDTDWIEKSVTIRSPTSFGYTKPVYFEFRAVRGYSYKSDIAVDDISLSVGECQSTWVAPAGTTTLFRHTITATPGTTTTRSWMESHPDYERCGSQYYNKQNQKCCRGLIRNGGRDTSCCGTNVYRPQHQVCCGDTVIWPRMQGCCRSVPYISMFSGCCNEVVYSRNRSVCRGGNVVPKS
ncbi:uncharacterized protein LOC100186219 [Ciona intestinalis]